MKVLIIALILTSGCSSIPFFTKEPEQVCTNIDKARQGYFYAANLYEKYVTPAVVSCAGKSTEKCKELREIDSTIRRLDIEVRYALENPGREVDWERVLNLLNFAIGLAL
jgi:hypothetical protein